MCRDMKKHPLVIVESPTKARTIGKFLPKNFEVEASIGHVRDLPQRASDVPTSFKQEPWARLGINVDEDFKPLYITPRGKGKIITHLKKKLKQADALYLATDEDREGESISWHLVDLLQPRVPVKRMVFHEITKEAIEQAIAEPRDIDMSLVKAQETRRILDRLYGYTLSPLIWKKIAYGLSAGRVQSPGLRMIVERERERIRFKKSVYWDLKAILRPNQTEPEFEAKLVEVNGNRIAGGKDFDENTGNLASGKDVLLLDEKAADELSERLVQAEWRVSEVNEKHVTSRPAAPFITSTLQQEANRKLGLSARDTMRIAQRLYEEGLITYMRTDSPQLSGEGIGGARECIESLYGREYLSEKPRQYTPRSRDAQEAHEAIRPAGPHFRHPQQTGLQGKERALYELIWKRTIATQMADAKKSQVGVRITAENATFSATGTRILFPGFLRVYVEGKDDPEAALEDKEVLLPDLTSGQPLTLRELSPISHETKPPARYTEASLVQRLEREGIGRPSTYASIISTIIERGYIRKQGNALVPTFTGFAVVQLLENHFPHLIEYSFTSRMEDALDEIAVGERESITYLREFYNGEKGLLNAVQAREDQIIPEASRTIELPHITNGVQIKIGRYGPYLVYQNKHDEAVHASIPEDIAPADLTRAEIDSLIELQINGPEPLGSDPETGKRVYCLIGRYGPYVQLGEPSEQDPKPKRASIPKGVEPREITLEHALRLLSLPRSLGMHPEKGAEVIANLGRFGPYVFCEGEYRSLKKHDDVYTIGLQRALELLAEEKKPRRGQRLIKDLGQDPEKGKKLAIYDGKYGPYIKHGSKNISLPDEHKDPEKLRDWTVEETMRFISEHRAEN